MASHSKTPSRSFKRACMMKQASGREAPLQLRGRRKGRTAGERTEASFLQLTDDMEPVKFLGLDKRFKSYFRGWIGCIPLVEGTEE